MNLPDTTPLIIAGLCAMPLAAWKLVDIVLWIAARIQWVSP